jgi:hypothetical protein
MTEEQQRNEEQGELESLGAKPTNWFWGADWACDFLMKTHPALLLVWSAVAIIAAAIFTFIGLQGMMNSNNDFPSSTIYLNEPAFHLAGLVAIPAFLLGVIGTLLPMWAVGRLIADAIRDGAKS